MIYYLFFYFDFLSCLLSDKNKEIKFYSYTKASADKHPRMQPC